MRQFILLLLAVFATAAFAQNTPYFRQPTLAGETLVFSSEGDLWVSDLTGGEARRLTSHIGEEAWPTLSPDGRRWPSPRSTKARATPT